MACYHPSEVYVESTTTERPPEWTKVPCGKCLGCRSDQAREWAIRIMHQAQVSKGAWFATLTYDPHHIPGPERDDDPPVPRGSLYPRDLQLSLKRLRRRLAALEPPETLRFYGCGEYGGRTERPHYHAVLLGPVFRDRVVTGHRDGSDILDSPTLRSAWGLGLTEISPVTWKSASYVAGYVTEKVVARNQQNRYTRFDPEKGKLVQVEPEFSRMSRRPAIAREWIEKYWTDVYPRDFVVMNGTPFKPPRYYDRWAATDHRTRRVWNSYTGEWDEQPHRPDCPCDSHRAAFEEAAYNRWKDATEIGDDKLIMKEKIHRARMGLHHKRDKV